MTSVPLGGRLATTLALVLLAAPAAAQRQVVSDLVARAPRPEDRDFAEALGAALDAVPGGLEGLTLFAQRGPLPAGTRLAGRGQRATCASDLRLWRVAFPTPAEAASFAANCPEPEAHAFSRGTSAYVLAGPGAEAAARDLAAWPGLEQASLAAVAGRFAEHRLVSEERDVTLTVPRGEAVGEGTRVRLDDGTVVLALRIAAPERYVYDLRAAPARRVAEQRGAHLLVIEGAALEDVERAAAVLTAAYSAAGIEQREREELAALAALSPDERDVIGGLGDHAALALVPGPLYQAGARLIREARERGEVRDGEHRRWFFDPETKNHLGYCFGAEAWGEFRLLPIGMLAAMARDEEGLAREKRYLLALLRALRVPPPPPAKGMIELLEQGGR